MTNIEHVGSAVVGFLAACVIALMTACPAAAQDEEKPRWFGATDGDTATLVYGVPNSDYVMLYFSCTISKPVVTVHVQDEESRAKEGALLRVRLSAGGAQIEFLEKAIPNEDSGGKDVKGHLPLDDTLRRILTEEDSLEIVVDGHKQRYTMEDAAKPAVAMLAACVSPKQTGNLDVTVTNKARLPLQSFAYSEAGVNSFDSGALGDKALQPGASRTFTISDGRKVCTFDISVVLAKDDAECCEEPKLAGTQDLCKNGTFIVHD